MNTVTQPISAGADRPAGAFDSGLSQFAGGGTTAAAPATQSFDISEYIRTIVKWKSFVFAAIILSVLAALLYSYTRTPLYSATSQIIQQDPAQLLPRTKAGGVPAAINNNQFLQTQLGLIKSDAQAKRVVARARLAQNPEYANQGSNAKDRADQAAARVRSQLTVEEVRESRLINITITSPSASTAANLANVYAEEFIAGNLERGFETTSYAREFLEKQLEKTRTKLEVSERELVGYASDQRIIELGTDKEGNASRSLDASNLVRLNDALADARIERITTAQNLRAGNLGIENAGEPASVVALRTQ